MRTITRFAPSPTGRMHLGHVLAARVAFSLASKSDAGTFRLRHEDIDSSRVREPFYRGIEDDLRWLGLQWAGEALRQTSRIEAYAAALASLRARDLVYPCFCTRREIQAEWARMTSAPHESEPQLYPGTCRKRSNRDQESKLRSGIPCAWRLDASHASDLSGPLTFHDLRFGTMHVDPTLLGDVVLARKDIGSAYHLAVVVDDAFQEISHVTRGQDLLTATHVHRLLQTLLDLPEPTYLHHPLLLDETGKRLAKRSESQSIATLRQNGMSAAALLALTDSALASAWIPPS